MNRTQILAGIRPHDVILAESEEAARTAVDTLAAVVATELGRG